MEWMTRRMDGAVGSPSHMAGGIYLPGKGSPLTIHCSRDILYDLMCSIYCRLRLTRHVS